MGISLRKFLVPNNYIAFLRRFLKFAIARGDIFRNPGGISDEDFEQIRIGIEEAKPRVFVEIGTGEGVSTTKVYNYLRQNFPKCHFYTLEVYKRYYKKMAKRFRGYETFHPLLGLSVLREETTAPAVNKLKDYSGPSDILRNLLREELKGRCVDIAFIDSRKGTALAEFMILERSLSGNGIIFCHDVLNDGKGVEVLEHLKKHRQRYSFEVMNTGPQGMIKVKLRKR